MTILFMLLALLFIVILIITHEFGHFIVAKRNGVEVEEFGLFFPPRLYKRKTKEGWVFSINAIPLGGFVKLKGEHDTDKGKGTFGAASVWVKSKIMLAGVFINFVTAVILFLLLAFIGIPKVLPNQFSVKSDSKISQQKVFITEVESGSPASKAGLKTEDQLLSITPLGGKTIPIINGDKLPDITQSLAGRKVTLTYLRNNKIYNGQTTLLTSNVVNASVDKFNKEIASTKLDCASIQDPKGYLGVQKFPYQVQRSTWSAPITAVGLSGQATALTFQGLGHAFGGLGSLIAGAVTGNSTARANGQCSASNQLAGPIGMYFILKQSTKLGINFFIFIIALIALSLAIFNLLPIPALDGGRLWLMLTTRLIRKPVGASMEELINAMGFILLIVLMIIVGLIDVHRFHVHI